MSKLTEALSSLLGDAVTMYFQAHGYHWNVEGQDFSQYHALFESIYEDVYSSIDPIAENIRKLDQYAPFALKQFMSLRTFDFGAAQQSPSAMAKALLKSNVSIIASLNKTFKAAMDEDEQGIANFLAERIDMHSKWGWQLRASTK
jgi:starvation-inducible DNA-binding protein